MTVISTTTTVLRHVFIILSFLLIINASLTDGGLASIKSYGNTSLPATKTDNSFLETFVIITSTFFSLYLIHKDWCCAVMCNCRVGHRSKQGYRRVAIYAL